MACADDVDEAQRLLQMGSDGRALLSPSATHRRHSLRAKRRLDCGAVGLGVKSERCEQVRQHGDDKHDGASGGWLGPWPPMLFFCVKTPINYVFWPPNFLRIGYVAPSM
jgi:hypothetical protein